MKIDLELSNLLYGNSDPLDKSTLDQINPENVLAPDPFGVFVERLELVQPAPVSKRDSTWDSPLIEKAEASEFEKNSAARIEKVYAAIDKTFLDHPEEAEAAKCLARGLRELARADAINAA
jgi:hypothetical protein